MNYSLYAARNRNWIDDAPCGGADPDLFVPAVESEAGLESVKQYYCNQCPVRILCLNSAIIDGESGYWGGMTSAQRRSLRRVRSRSKCPVCSNTTLVAVDDSEVCVSCGASWKAGDRPTVKQSKLRAATARPEHVEDVPLTEAAASCL